MDFEEQLTVIRIRKRYSAPFLKYKYIYLKKEDLKSKKAFINKMSNIVKTWPDSEYQLKLSSGKVFIKFLVRDGIITDVFTKSNITGKNYPVAEIMKK